MLLVRSVHHIKIDSNQWGVWWPSCLL